MNQLTARIAAVVAAVGALVGLPADLPVLTAASVVVLVGVVLWLARRIDGITGTSAAVVSAAETRRDVAVAEAQRLAVLLAALEDGVLAMAGGHEIAYANPAAERLLGAPATQGSAPLPPGLQRAIELREATELDIELTNPARVLSATVDSIDEGALVVVTLRDVSAQRRTEAIRRDFVSAASHELKTPVASIHASAETILAALDDEPDVARKFAKRTRKTAKRLSRIVSDLLDLSRLDAGGVGFEMVDLEAIVEAELERAADADREVAARLEPASVHGSASDLSLAVRNLLDNALQYTAEDEAVSVSLAPQDGGYRLTVADEGTGIPKDDLDRIFERFYRVDAARSRATGGTGLGLAIVRHVADLHGGVVDVESRLGEGSVFRLWLPADARVN